MGTYGPLPNREVDDRVRCRELPSQRQATAQWVCQAPHWLFLGIEAEGDTGRRGPELFIYFWEPFTQIECLL